MLLQLEQRGYKPDEVGKILHCSKTSVINLMNEQRLGFAKPPGGRVCYPEHIYDYLATVNHEAAAITYNQKKAVDTVRAQRSGGAK